MVCAGVKVDSTLPFSPGHVAGSCNDYLPTDSTFARFLWNVHMLAANGMYVLIDDHSNFDTTIVTNYAAWVEVRPPLLPCQLTCNPLQCSACQQHPHSVEQLKNFLAQCESSLPSCGNSERTP
jgi:hypothetical protein